MPCGSGPRRRRRAPRRLVRRAQVVVVGVGRHVGRAPLELTSHAVRHLELLSVRPCAVQGALALAGNNCPTASCPGKIMVVAEIQVRRPEFLFRFTAPELGQK